MQTASFYHMLSVIYLLIIARTEILVQIIFELNTIITPPILLGRRTTAPPPVHWQPQVPAYRNLREIV